MQILLIWCGAEGCTVHLPTLYAFSYLDLAWVYFWAVNSLLAAAFISSTICASKGSLLPERGDRHGRQRLRPRLSFLSARSAPPPSDPSHHPGPSFPHSFLSLARPPPLFKPHNLSLLAHFRPFIALSH